MPPRAPLSFVPQQSLPKYARTVDRGVRLKIRPRPRNIQDSRHILSYLRNYGHIVLYQYLKYDPLAQSENIALALYRDEAEAEKLLAASPVRLEVSAEGARPVPQQDGETVTGGHVFDIWIERSSTSFHARQLRQADSGPYTLDRSTAMFEDLKRRVPIPALGDLRFDKGAVPLRLRRKEGGEGMAQERWNKGHSLWDMWRQKRES